MKIHNHKLRNYFFSLSMSNYIRIKKKKRSQIKYLKKQNRKWTMFYYNLNQVTKK